MYNIIRDTKPAEKGLLKKDPYNATKTKEYSVDEIIQEFRVFVLHVGLVLQENPLQDGILLMTMIWGNLEKY